MIRRVATWAAVVVLLLCTATLIGWRVHGGRWVRVETASMGTMAPVGSLLWVAPTNYDALQVGDLINFVPPGASTTYTHLVRAVNDDGSISTQGKITAPDPWRIRSGDVVGKVVLIWPGIGWLVLAAPILIIGGLLVASIVSRLRQREMRLPVIVVGGALVIAVAILVHRPLTRADQMSFVPVDGGARATYVSTGLLPVRLHAAGGDQVLLHDGEVGSVLAPAPDVGGKRQKYQVDVKPALPWEAWLVLIGVCFVPAVVRTVRPRGLHAA